MVNSAVKKEPFTGLVLAGGRSTRMGRDKALLRLPDGRTLLERAVAILREAGAGEVIVSTGSGRSYGMPGTCEVVDDLPDKGPLAGLVAGFAIAADERIVVLAVDLPHITREFVIDLLGLATAQRGIVPMRTDLAEPLAAVYPRSAYESARVALRGGRLSLQEWVRGLHQAGLVNLQRLDEAQLPLFANWNTPEECR